MNESRVVCLTSKDDFLKTLWVHKSRVAWCALLKPCLTKYCCNSCTQHLAAVWVFLTTISLPGSLPSSSLSSPWKAACLRVSQHCHPQDCHHSWSIAYHCQCKHSWHHSRPQAKVVPQQPRVKLVPHFPCTQDAITTRKPLLWVSWLQYGPLPAASSWLRNI